MAQDEEEDQEAAHTNCKQEDAGNSILSMPEILCCDVCSVQKANVLCNNHNQAGGMVFCHGCDMHAHSHEGNRDHPRFLLIAQTKPSVSSPCPSEVGDDGHDYLGDLMNFDTAGNTQAEASGIDDGHTDLPIVSEFPWTEVMEEAEADSPKVKKTSVWTEPCRLETTAEVSEVDADEQETMKNIASTSGCSSVSEGNPLNRPISPSSHLPSDTLTKYEQEATSAKKSLLAQQRSTQLIASPRSRGTVRRQYDSAEELAEEGEMYNKRHGMETRRQGKVQRSESSSHVGLMQLAFNHKVDNLVGKRRTRQQGNDNHCFQDLDGAAGAQQIEVNFDFDA